jgi:hypothetical protein
VLLLGLIVAFASEAMAAKPTAEDRDVRNQYGRTPRSRKLNAQLRAVIREAEVRESILATDLPGVSLWVAYVNFGLVWLGSAARRRTSSAQKPAKRVRRTARSGATRSSWNAFGGFARAAASRPRRVARLLAPSEL